MGTIVLTGATSGSTTIQPTDAVTAVLTLPSTTGTLAVSGGSPSFSTITTTNDASISGLTVGKGGGAVASATAFGYQAAYTNTTGTNLTAIGYQAGYTSNATDNTFVGRQAGQSTSSGGSNTALGSTALANNSTGADNTALGKFALVLNTTGSSNTSVGKDALYSNTTASNNTAVGYQAGYTGTTSAYNTYLGYQAGYTANYSGNGFNTCIGAQVGYSLTTGYGNTFIGGASSSSGYYVTTGSNNTILGGYTGNQSGLDIRTASNYIVLSDGAGNPRNYIDSSGYNYLLGSGGGRIYFRDTSNTAQYSIQSTSGTFYIFSAANYAFLSGTGFSSWSFASDARIKENIVDLDYGLNSIMALKPRRFDYISNKQNDIGFIAQEIQSVIPEAVTGKEIEFSENDTQQERAEKTMGVSKDLLIPVLVKAIQELNATVQTQAAQIAALTAKVGA